MLEQLAPVFAMISLFSVPLAVIFTKHQQKMAMIVRNQISDDPNDSTRRTIQDLTFLAHQQSMQIQALTEAMQRLERQLPSSFESQVSGRH